MTPRPLLGRLGDPRLWMASALLTFWGCSAGQTPREDIGAPDLAIPEAFATPDEGERGSLSPRETLPEAWCQDFGTPSLPPLIRQVLDENLDLRVAATRVREADAQLALLASQRRPRVGAEASVGSGNVLVPGLGGSSLETRTTYGLGATASWELDLWGRIRDQLDAAEADRAALTLDMQGVALALAARTADAFFGEVRAREERALLDEQLETARTFASLVEARFRRGQATMLDVLQQRQNIEELESRAVRLDLESQLAALAIAQLLGLAEPVSLEASDALPRLEGVSLAQVPADLLERRPDVAAARLRAVAADHRVDAALKERLPRLRVSASLSLQANNLSELFNYLFWSLGASASQSIWEGGRVAAEVERHEAIRERALLLYAQSLLEAIQEVQRAMTQAHAQLRALEEQRLQLELARASLDAARQRYRGGDVDFLRVLTAQQVVQRLELAELESRRTILTHQIDLCRAAGGILPEARPSTGDAP